MAPVPIIRIHWTWIPFSTTRPNFPSSGPYRSLLPPNSQLLNANRQILGLHTCFNVISCSPCWHIPIARNHLLLCDLQFSVLLASHVLSIPSTLSSSLYIQLVLGPQTLTKTHVQVTGQVLLILSSLPPGKDKEKASAKHKSTSVFFVILYTVPSTATISTALGLGGASDKWLCGLDDQNSSIKPTAAETSRTKLLTTIRSAVEGGRSQAAAAAFIKWVSQDGDEESSDINRGPKPALSRLLEYNFVKELLNIILLRMQPNSNVTAAGAASAYSPEIIRYLLEKQVVCSAMIEGPGGLLGAL